MIYNKFIVNYYKRRSKRYNAYYNNNGNYKTRK